MYKRLLGVFTGSQHTKHTPTDVGSSPTAKALPALNQQDYVYDFPEDMPMRGHHHKRSYLDDSQSEASWSVVDSASERTVRAHSHEVEPPKLEPSRPAKRASGLLQIQHWPWKAQTLSASEPLSGEKDLETASDPSVAVYRGSPKVTSAYQRTESRPSAGMSSMMPPPSDPRTDREREIDNFWKVDTTGYDWNEGDGILGVLTDEPGQLVQVPGWVEALQEKGGVATRQELVEDRYRA